MAPWLRFLEAWMVQQLLRTPAFHRGVEKVARTVHRVRHGSPPEEMGGTRIDQPENNFLRHFTEEVSTQLGRAEAHVDKEALKASRSAARAGNERGQSGVEEALGEDADAVWKNSQKSASRPSRSNVAKTLEKNADAAWRNRQKGASEPPRQGFLGEYIGALRDQLRNGK